MEFIFNENAHVNIGFLADDDEVFGCILETSDHFLDISMTDTFYSFDEDAFILEEEDEENWEIIISNLFHVN